MADSCCIAELKEIIEKMNVELSQSRTKISELDAKVREQEEENTRLTRDLKECKEKCKATQKRLKFAEQKLAQFSHKPQTAAQTRRNLIIDGSSCSDGSDSDEDRRNPISDSSSSCSHGPDSDDSLTHVRHPQTRRNLIIDGSSCSDGSDSDEDRRNPISDSSSSCSHGPDSDDSPTHVRHPQISFPLVEKDGNSGVVKYGSNIKHVLKRKKPDEETKENNVKTIKFTSILKDGSKVIAELEQVKEELGRSELESEIDKYKEQCTDLQSENEKLQSENEKFQSENEKLQSENEKLQSENEKLQRENKRLQKYLQDLESASVNVEKRPICHSDVTGQITKVNESSNDALDINSLPDEILVKVFGYLKQNKLGQIARVCRRWNALTKSGVLWRKVNVEIFFPSDRSENITVKSFINGLPSCVTFIRLFFYEYGKWMAPLDFEELCLRLQEKCPHLEELILNTSQLSNSLSSVIDLCTKYLQNIKNLIFQYVKFRCDQPTGEGFGISKIEKLELYYCTFDYSNKPLFTKMPYLKHLHVCGDDVGDSWIGDDGSFLNQLHVLHQTWSEINSRTFSTIQDKGLNLRELYCCGLSLHQGHDLTFTNSAFPHLETICISPTGVTCESVVSLIQSHPSLENVYVDENVAESFAAHPFVLANRCKAGIVKAIKWGHDHKVDYPATRF